MRKVPKLRFKEFTDEWEEKKLGEIAEITSGLTPLRSEEKFYLNGTIPWIKTSDLNNSYIKETEEKISEVALKETSIKLLPKNILLVAMYGGFNQIGRTGLTTMEATTNQALSAIKFKNINKFPLFFQNVLNYKVDYWKKVSASSRKDPNITKKDIENFKVFYPKLEEQEKIANFLSDVDKKIYLTEEKLELFKEYKKGIMQKIFSQELRFKDNEGNDYPEWEEKRLGEIGNTYNGLTGKNAEDFGKGKKYITYKNIYDNTKINIDILELVNIALGEKQNKVEYGDIFFTTSSETPNEVGYTSVLLAKVQEDIYLNSFCFGFRLGNKIKYLPEFFRYLLRSQNFRNSIYILAQGSTRFNLSKIELLKLKILLPTSEEQEKISNFLSSIDTKIEKIEKELENLKEFKKGLLQQMFI